MKNISLLITVLAFSAGVNAQSFFPQPASASAACPDSKLLSTYSQMDKKQFAGVAAAWKPADQNTPVAYTATINARDCYMMIENIMFSVNNGTLTCMTKYTKVKNGDVVLVNGLVITHAGKVVHLKNGDNVNMEGHINHKPFNNTNAEVAVL